jgi:hypothetical protein
VKYSISKKHRISNQKNDSVVEIFSGKNLTRFGGTGLIRRFLTRHRIEDRLNKYIQVEGRRESKYSVGRMFISLLYGIILGYSRPGHMGILYADRVFQKLAGLDGFPHQSTVSRFLSILRVGVSHQIARLNRDLLMKVRRGFECFSTLTLDLDSHVTPVYGKQQRAGVGYNPRKKGRRSYHPLLCFVGETRDYLGGFLRNGKHHTSYQAIPFVERMLNILPSHIKGIRLRADSGFFSIEMLEFLTRRGIEFYVVVPMKPYVQKLIMRICNWQGIGGGREVSECELTVGKNVQYRMIVVRKRVPCGKRPQKQLKLLHMDEVIYDYQAIVTSSDLPSEEVWQTYNQRACCENFIKEGIYGFGLDQVVSHHWGGNNAYFQLLMFAYNLINLFKEEVLTQRHIKQMTQTIRERLFLIPGKLIRTCGRWILKLERTWYYREPYEEALGRVT